MGRKSVLFGFALLGFTLGFTGYLASPSIGAWLMEILPQIFISEALAGAFLAGVGGSLITTVSAALWARHI
jgi:hypothetical protein